MATSNTEKVIGLLFDELGFTDPSISPESDSNIASEVTIPLEQRAAIFARVEASMQTRKKAFFERHSSSESEKVEVIPKNIPQRNNRQQTEDRKLLGQQMEDPRLGGLTVDECKDLTEIFKAKLRTTVTNRTIWEDYKECCRGRKIMAEARMRAIERINVPNTEERGPSGSEQPSTDVGQQTSLHQENKTSIRGPMTAESEKFEAYLVENLIGKSRISLRRRITHARNRRHRFPFHPMNRLGPGWQESPDMRPVRGDTLAAARAKKEEVLQGLRARPWGDQAWEEQNDLQLREAATAEAEALRPQEFWRRIFHQ